MRTIKNVPLHCGRYKVPELLRTTVTALYVISVLAFLVTIVDVGAEKFPSKEGKQTSGWTEPKEDISIKTVESLEICCTLNTTSGATDLVFGRNDEKIEDGNVRPINETTNSLHMKNTIESEDCSNRKLEVSANQEDLVRANLVAVSTKASEVAPVKQWCHSQAASRVKRSDSGPPRRSPQTEESFFSSVPINATSRNVTVYWQPVGQLETSEFKESNKTFYYQIEVYQNGSLIFNTSIFGSNSWSAREVLLSNTSYRFGVRSANEFGAAAEKAADVRVPAQNDLVEHCFNVMAYDYGNGTYVLSWQAPRNVVSVQYYIILWKKASASHECDECNKKECWDNCMMWRNISAVSTNHTFTLNRASSYQFAMSVNTATSSSGLEWVKCQLKHDEACKMEKEPMQWGNTSSSVLVGWDPVCVNKTLLRGYRIYYCKLSDNSAESTNGEPCHSPETIKNVDDVMKTSYNFTDLESNTSYKMAVEVYTRDNCNISRSPYSVIRTPEKVPQQIWVWVIIVCVTLIVIILMGYSNVVKWFECLFRMKIDPPKDYPPSPYQTDTENLFTR